jgi:hypothetical protein
MRAGVAKHLAKRQLACRDRLRDMLLNIGVHVIVDVVKRWRYSLFIRIQNASVYRICLWWHKTGQFFASERGGANKNFGR